jgi:hypothetical protein
MSPEQTIAKGNRAAMELAETSEAFEAMKALLIEKWAATGVDDTPTREKYFAAFNAINMVRKALEVSVSNGRVEAHSAEMAALLAPERR